MEYEQLIPWVKPTELDSEGNWQEASAKAFRVIPGDYVTTEDGTGIVHSASFSSTLIRVSFTLPRPSVPTTPTWHVQPAFLRSS